MNQQFLPANYSASAKESMNAEAFKSIRKRNILMFLILFCFSSTTQAQVDLDSGLVAYYPFNGNVNDESGNGNNGVVNGALLTNDRFGINKSAYIFNSSQCNYITVPHSETLVLPKQLTISAWVKRNKLNSYDFIVEKGGDWNRQDPNYGFGHNLGDLAFYYDGAVEGCKGISDLFWHHLVVTADKDATPKLRFYIDGIERKNSFYYTEGAKINFLNTTNKLPLHIGSQIGNPNYCGNNTIDELRIYNRVLSESEIRYLYQMTPDTTGIFNVSPQTGYINEKKSDLIISANPITSESTVELVNEEGNTIKPDSIFERGNYFLTARFSWENQPAGIYDVVLISPSDTLRLGKGFKLVHLTEAEKPLDTDNDGYLNLSTFANLVWFFENDSCWSMNFELDNDIDASESENWYEGSGFKPITSFSGIIDGQGHKIKYLHMSRSAEDYVAFIGQLGSSGIIRNLGLTNCNIKGKNNVSSFLGKNNGGTISNCYSNGSISGNENTGGLVGNNFGTIKYCYNASFVNGVRYIGGLAGNSNSSSKILMSYNIGKVVGSINIIGGVIGTNSGKISDCYNSGSVVGAGETAGISGWNYGTLSNTYNRGYVNCTGNFCGAMIGYQSGSITNSYWDKQNSGLTTSNGGTGKTANEMKSQSAYPNWDFTDTWEILSTLNDGYPQLTWAKTTSLIKSYSPERVANSGSATITFEGINFDSNTKVCLYKTGQDTLKADTIYTSDTFCSTKFNFNNAALGAWNILVQYPDTTVTIKNGLTVEETKIGKLDIEILGPDVFRKGRATTVTVRVTNKGNTAITSPFILIAIDSKDSKFIARSLNSTISDSIASSFNKMGLNIKGFSFLKAGDLLGHADRLCRLGIFVFPTISGYSSYDFPVEITSEEDIAISAWQQENYTVSDFLGSLKYESSSQKLKSANIDYNCVSSFGQCLSGVIGTTVLGGNQFSLFNTTVSAGFYTMDQSATTLGVRPNSQMKDIGMLMWGTAGSIALTVGLATGVSEIVIGAAIINGLVLGVQCSDAINGCNPNGVTLFEMWARGSFDPNDKYGYRSPSGSKYFKEDKTNFTYVIEFENKETATAAAQEVFITDTLDTKVFDIQSFKAGSIKIGSTTYEASLNARDAKWTIDMRPAMNYITYVTLKLDTATAVAKWYFKSVDPVTLDWPTDPTAGFLPPNDSTGRGQGSVSFTINLKDGLSDETTLNNHATIVFDTNDPIKTPTWTNKKDVVAPTSSMSDPEIVADNVAHLTWDGTDNKNGSGVYCYNLFIKKDNGDYEQYLTRTTSTSTDFEYDPNSGYSFYVTAIDSAENVEIKTNVPDVSLYKTDVKMFPSVQDNVVNVVPNPNNGTFTVSTTFDGKSLLTITTLSGQKIYGPVPFVQSVQVNLVGLSKGIYLCVVKNSNQIKTQKMEIQ